jgi:hypothetical protein
MSNAKGPEPDKRAEALGRFLDGGAAEVPRAAVNFLCGWDAAVTALRAEGSATYSPAEPDAWMVPFREVSDSAIEYALDHANDGREYLLERVRACDLHWVGEPIPLFAQPVAAPEPLTDEQIDSEIRHMVQTDDDDLPTLGGLRALVRRCLALATQPEATGEWQK